jgi:tetratricopeptide (TPR) repeat protein
LALIFSFLSSGLSAQNLYIKTDSLQKALPSLKGVEHREAMRQIIEYSEEFSKDISKEYSLRLFEEAKMVGDTFYMIEGLYNLGMVEKLDGNFFQANQYLNELISLAKKMKNPEFQAKNLTRVSIILSLMDMSDLAFTYLEQAIVLLRNSSDIREIVNLMQTIAQEYYRLRLYHEAIGIYRILKIFLIPQIPANDLSRTIFYRDYAYALCMNDYLTDALYYADKAREIAMKNHSLRDIYNLDRLYGLIYNKMQNNDKVIQYLEPAALQTENYGYLLKSSYIHNELAHYLQQAGDYSHALEHQLKALRLRQKANFNSVICFAYINYGDALMKAGKMDSAFIYLSMGKDLASKMNFKTEIRRAYEKLGDYYMRTNRFDKALAFIKEARDIQDKEAAIQSEQQRKLLALNTEAQSYNEKNLGLKEIESKQNIFFILIAGIILLLIVILWLYYINHRREDFLRSIEIKQKILASQLNPTFIFNMLVGIRGIIRQGRNEEAGKYLAGFAKLIREILVSSQHNYQFIEREIDMLNSYLELQKIRFSGLLNYEIHLSQSLDSSRMGIPPFLCHSILENFFNFIADKNDKPFHIFIDFQEDNNSIVETIKINLDSEIYHQNLGSLWLDELKPVLELIKERITIICKSKKNHY